MYFCSSYHNEIRTQLPASNSTDTPMRNPQDFSSQSRENAQKSAGWDESFARFFTGESSHALLVQSIIR